MADIYVPKIMQRGTDVRIARSPSDHAELKFRGYFLVETLPVQDPVAESVWEALGNVSVSYVIDDAGHLIITQDDGDVVDAGLIRIKGDKGDPGTASPADVAAAIGDASGPAGQVISGLVRDGIASAGGARNRSLYLVDFLTPGASDADNRTAFVAAIAAAEAGAKQLCYDGAFFSYSGATVTSTAAGMLHWASSWDTHKVTSKTKGYGGLVVAGANSTVENLYVSGNNPALDFTGVTIGGAQTFRHSVGVRVDPTAHNTVLRNIRGDGFMYLTVVASLTAAQMTSGGVAPTDRVRNVEIDGLQCDGCWTAHQYTAPAGLKISRVRGWWQDVTGSGGEGHLIYGGGYGDAYPAYDVVASDFICTGGEQHGLTDNACAFKFVQTVGLTVSDMVAYDSPGLLDIEKCPGAIIGEGIKGIRDNTRGAVPSIQFIDSPNMAVAEISLSHVGDVTAGQSFAQIVRCSGTRIEPMRITCNPPTAIGAYGLTVSGLSTGTVITRPSITNLGANLAEGIRLSGTEDLGVIVDDPEIVGSFSTGVRCTFKGFDLRYRKARLGGTRRIAVDAAATPFKITNLEVPPPAVTRLLGWHRGEDMNSSSPTSTWPSGQQKAFAFGNNWAGDYAGRITETASGGRRILTAAFGSGDVDISADVLLSTATRAGLCLRASGDSTYLAVSRTTGAVKIHKVVAGTTTELATVAVTLPNGAFGNLRALIVGAVVSVFLNNVQVLSYTLTGGDETTFTAINHGIYGDTAGAAAWENLQVRSVA